MERFLERTQLFAITGASGQLIVYDDNALYKNLKVPFAADYADGDVNVLATSTHGIHVAGTVAGYAETAEGEVIMREVSLGSITVPASGSIDVNQTVSLTAEEKAELDQLFKNGSYIEGYVILSSDSNVQIGLPFLGFYGDWTAAPIYDDAVWVNDIGDASDDGKALHRG